MKKKNTKENANEAKRVFVENLPKPKSWWQENAGIIIIACLALVVPSIAVYVSVGSLRLARQEFIASHRPYVYGICRQMTRDDKTIMDVNTVLLACLNAPAKITNREIYYVAVRTKENGEERREIKFEKKFRNEIVLYPTEIPTSQITVVQYDLEKEILAIDPEVKLKRKVRIDYKELSSDRKYYFEGNWDYNRQYSVWEPNNMFGD